MFIARYENTMRNARFALELPAVQVRTIEQIRAEKRRERAIDARRLAEKDAKQKADAERNLAAVRAYRCINIRGELTPARDIIRWVAQVKGFTVDELLSNRRNRELVAARFDAIKAVADARPDLSLPQIGKVFGRDHTTILHALRKRGGRSLQHREG